jgi:hypothetical protein
MKISEIINENSVPSVELSKAPANFVPPQKTVKAYKLFRVNANRPGELFPLFVHADRPVKIGQWYEAEEGISTVDAKTGKSGVKSTIGQLAYRPGWHAGDYPLATHIGGDRKVNPLTGKQAPTSRPDDQVWAEVEMPADVDWQEEANRRAMRLKKDSKATGLKAGDIRPDTAHITDQIPKGGHYRYKTNPNMTGNWIIGGAMRVTRVLSDDEVERLNSGAGYKDLPRNRPFDNKKYGF